MKFKYRTILGLLLILLNITSLLIAQPNKPVKVAGYPVNYDESLVGEYELPNPLILNNGKPVTSQADWTNKRRPELIKLFEEYQFGKSKPKPKDLSFKVIEEGTLAFEGKAIRKQVTIYFTKDTSQHKINLLMYFPVNKIQPSPLLLTISFSGNSTAVNDDDVKPGMVWKDGKKILDVASTFRKVDVEKFISNGIAYATFYYGDIEPDFKQGMKYGIRSQYLKPNQFQVGIGEWGAISAWSWGLSRVMDYLETDKDVDVKKVALTGASRLGKTVLWTGARDTRFAMVIASISGECGAALSRRNFGETIAHMTDTSRYFYHYTPKYHDFSHKVNELPVDGHMLVSLIAPRPLLLQTGDTDYWSDPIGEYLSAQAAEPVYQLFGKQGVGSKPKPNAGDDSMLNTLGYFMHAGGHTVLPEDYDIFIRYMNKHFELTNK